MLKAGASGYLMKDSASREVIHAIRMVMADKAYLSPEIANIVLEKFVSSPNDEATAYTLLTSREREVLQLIAEGKTTAKIADLLCLSVKTIETYRMHIMQKLKITSIAELTKYAVKEGLTKL